MSPLILLPGMGADERMFAAQRDVFGDRLITPRWINPVEGESIASYAKRLALKIDPKRPCYVGGASFGGFVAIEMARHLQTLAVILIGSVRGPDELPKSLRALRSIRKLLAVMPLELLASAGIATARMSAGARGGVVAQLAEADGNFIRWACEAVLEWTPTPPDQNVPPAPVHQIHGDADHILPVRLTRPTRIVKGGGHVLSVTHPNDVNRFLNDAIE